MITDKRTLAKLQRMEGTYESLMFTTLDTISLEMFETDEHLRAVPGDENPWQAVEEGCTWGKAWGNAWFRGTFSISDELASQNLFIRAELGGVETMMFVDGEERGIFSKEAEVGARGNHHTLMLHRAGQAGGVRSVAFECYAGHPCIGTQPMDPRENGAYSPAKFSFAARKVSIMERRDDVMAFVFDLKALNQLAAALPETSFRRGNISRALTEVFRIVPQCPDEVPEERWQAAIKQAREIMAPQLACKNGDSAPFVGLTGHSHMDTAWLWTSKETIRKCARTFSNALNLMEQYPEYRFIQSSPIHAEMIKTNYPKLFQRIKASVDAGRWEPNGAMYVESDGNMPSGESFVRQFLYGQMFTREHFGYTADAFWLPDTFGYSAAFPQIMKGCDVKYFLTTKLSWNDTTKFPYDTFVWRGIDGTEVLVHFNVTHGPPDVQNLINQTEKGGIRHADVSDKRLISYGKGDGGGGPTFEEIEMARRLDDLEGCPRSKHMSVSEFMGLLEAEQDRYPVYDGELYVELHRGVLTGQAQIKKLNRQCEWALRNMELMDVIGQGSGLAHLDRKTVADRWKVLLKNQFHDILPGTSIPEEHDEAIRALGELLAEASACTEEQLAKTVQPTDSITVLNPLSWADDADLVVPALPEGCTLGSEENLTQQIETIDGEKKTVVANVARDPLSLTSVKVVKQSVYPSSPFNRNDNVLETPFYKATFDRNGYIESLVDCRTGRELRGSGLPLNTFLLGEDLPRTWDNWDIDTDQVLKMAAVDALETSECSDGPLQYRIRNRYRLGQKSVLVQDMVFHKNTPRIDFETKVDWQETHSLLKVGFDLNIRASRFKSEIQFGWTERTTHTNTPYDLAKFEVSQHKWSDLSEPGYGVALLNDCKYGIGVRGSDMRLSLLKSGGHPDARGDAGVHTFKYALLTHTEGFSAESVIRPAYEFNQTTVACSGELEQADPPFVTVDQPNIIVDCIKRAEDGNGTILRLVEAEGTGTSCCLSFGRTIATAELTNMLEETQSPLTLNGNSMNLEFSAFEVKTVRIVD